MGFLFLILSNKQRDHFNIKPIILRKNNNRFDYDGNDSVH